jgi:hypothetical protein
MGIVPAPLLDHAPRARSAIRRLGWRRREYGERR